MNKIEDKDRMTSISDPSEKGRSNSSEADIRQSGNTDILNVNQRIQLALESGNIGTWEWDIRNDILSWSDEIKSLFGYPPDIIPSLDVWKNSLFPDDLDRSVATLQTAVRTNSRYFDEYRIRVPSPGMRWIRSVGNSFHEDGKTVRLIGICIDVTDLKLAEEEMLKFNTFLEQKIEERTADLKENNGKLIAEIAKQKKTEQELKLARAEAEKANAAKSEFLSGISHEIRTPMNAIIGYADLLKPRVNGKEENEYIDFIKTNGRTLLSIIDDILYLSEIEAGRLIIEPNYIDTFSFFSQFEKIFEFRLKEKGLLFIVNFGKDIPSGIFTDGALLRQIILNLAGNAIEYTKEGSITLEIKAINRRVINSFPGHSREVTDMLIEVSDSGPGIEEAYREKIFDSFFRIRAASARSGAGLGLAIARRLARLMKGNIELHTEAGKGSTFSVFIPEVITRGEKLMPELIGKREIPEIEFRPGIIVVAHSSSIVRRSVIDAASSPGLVFAEAANGLQAIKLIREMKPLLIICDILLPGLDGFEILELVNNNEELMIIPVVAYSDTELTPDLGNLVSNRFAGLLINSFDTRDIFSLLLKYLPYRTTIESPFRSEKTAGTLRELPENAEELIRKLDSEGDTMWKKLSVRQPIGEVRSFAEFLSGLGKIHNYKSLSEYGNELSVATDTFNIETILRLISQYPGKVEAIKKLR